MLPESGQNIMNLNLILHAVVNLASNGSSPGYHA